MGRALEAALLCRSEGKDLEIPEAFLEERLRTNQKRAEGRDESAGWLEETGGGGGGGESGSENVPEG